ncbi:MAG: sulfatase [Verrucomicrobiales bacterium]|nr:sulfatase [Verrucomicrobiales bacterium]
MHRIFLLFLFVTFPAFAREKPNVVFILADDLGWADTTLYGHTSLYETPNLERLAKRGMTFERAYTASPLCSPTRSSILTGLHPARTGLTSPNCHTPKIVLKASTKETGPPNKKLTGYDSVTRLDTKYETLSKRFQQEGYTTAHFGKWHLGSEPYSPLEHGFDIDIPHWHGPGPAGSFVAPWKFKNFTEKYPKEHIEDRMGDEAVAFMEKHKEQPFFVNYWQFSVHAPFDAKAELIKKYRSKINPDDEQRSPTYAAMVQSLDENVGKMLNAIDRLGITDNTVIVFFSDNGGNMYNEIDGTTPTSNRPLRGGKGNNWDGGVRVPAVVVWPGQVEAGSRSDELITSTDFYPTLLEVCGLEPGEGRTFDGVSIVPAMKGQSLERDAIFTHFPHSTGVPDTLPPSAAVYQGDWKLFRFFHDGPKGAHRHSLYHVKEDIGEKTDLSAEQPERVAAMAKRLDEFLTDTGAVYPAANPNYTPGSETLTKSGVAPAKGCSLKIREGNLVVKVTENNPKLNLTLKKAADPGDLILRVQLKAPSPGSIDLRWAEKGVKPTYFKDRRVVSNPFRKAEATDLEIPFTAKNPVTSFRLDFPGVKSGTISIDEISLLRAGETEHKWTFDN